MHKLRERTETASFMFFSRQLLELIEKYKDRLPNKRRIEKIVKKH